MQDYDQAVNAHYGQVDLGQKLLDALQAAGKPIERLTRDDIMGFDEFHIRGREATREMARLSGLEPGMTVLDIGSGLGGPARTLVAEFNCRVTGLDLVEAYCEVATLLTRQVGMSDQPVFRQGSALKMPFEDDTFDRVWLQHVTMNIPDKERLIAEIRRVLRPGGRLAIYEIYAGPAGPPHFPVPWAEEPSLSFLATPEAMQEVLREAGFQQEVWRDVSAEGLDWFRGVRQKIMDRPADAPPPLGLNLLMGASAPVKSANMVRNLEEGRVQVIQGVFLNGAG